MWKLKKKSMKSILSLITILMITLSSTAQTNFKWEKVDSVNKTKAQIYTDTKMFIAKTWKSAQDVIQNDDKEAGMILIKGNMSKHIIVMGIQDYCYTYNYTITFLMKDNKFKITLDNVYCESAIFMTNPSAYISKIQPFEGECTEGFNKKKTTVMMAEVKTGLQELVDSYLSEIKTPTVTKEW